MNKNPLFILHIAVFLFGFTAILGKLLSIQEYSLVWWRMLISSLVFLVFPKFFSELKKLNKRQIYLFLGIGFLVALHWITFYGSIKAADSASLTLACFGLTASFTSILEPIILRQRLRIYELLLGLVAFGGIYFIYLASPNTGIPAANFNKALTYGVISSFLAALFSSLNAKHIKHTNPIQVTFLELVGGFLLVSIYFLFDNKNDFQWLSTSQDILWMLLLTVVCTNLAFVLNLQAMKKLSAFTANIAINLEPVYGIILAAFIFNENQNLNLMFYIGTAIILATVFLHPIFRSIAEKKFPKKQVP